MSRARAKPGSDTITNTNSTGTGSGSSSRRAIITASASLGSSVLPKSSKFRGVTLFRPTGKWRAQISLGGQTTSLGDHDTEHEAARAFDRAALHFKGNGYAATNFGIGEYARELPELMRMSQAELVAELRARARKGRPVSSFRGVSRAWQSSRWHAQITIAGKQVHLGYFHTEEEAARAYDKAAIYKSKTRAGRRPAVTNLSIHEYDTKEVAALIKLTLSEVASHIASGGIDLDYEEDYDNSSDPLLISNKADSSVSKMRVRSVGENRKPHVSNGNHKLTKDSDMVLGGRQGIKRSATPSDSTRFPMCTPRSKDRRTRMQPCRAAC